MINIFNRKTVFTTTRPGFAIKACQALEDHGIARIYKSEVLSQDWAMPDYKSYYICKVYVRRKDADNALYVLKDFY